MYYKIEIIEKNSFKIEFEIEKNEIDWSKNIEINDILDKVKEDMNKLINWYKRIVWEKKLEDFNEILKNDEEIFIN